MNGADEAVERAYAEWIADKPRFAAGGFDNTVAHKSFTAGAEWARKEALREAEDAVQSLPATPWFKVDAVEALAALRYQADGASS